VPAQHFVHLPPFSILIDLHSWKDVNLNWSLISALEKNETIKQVLFPMPREKAALNVAGKPKTEALEQQYRLVVFLVFFPSSLFSCYIAIVLTHPPTHIPIFSLVVAFLHMLYSFFPLGFEQHRYFES